MSTVKKQTAQQRRFCQTRVEVEEGGVDKSGGGGLSASSAHFKRNTLSLFPVVATSVSAPIF